MKQENRPSYPTNTETGDPQLGTKNSALLKRLCTAKTRWRHTTLSCNLRSAAIQRAGLTTRLPIMPDAQ
ncbi:MAG: hypothetical protein ACR2RF_26480 [Geminicoccaceae bacterium]